MANILIVDDTDLIRELIIDLLAVEKRYKIFQAINGLEAQTKIKTNNPFIDLVITDVSMPEMNGVELTLWIKKEYPKMPVIMMSADEHRRSLVADRFIRKTDDMLTIPSAINELLLQQIPA